MRVDVSGNTFQFPHFCACCGRNGQMAALPVAFTKTTGKRVVHSSTTAWDIPYCIDCAGHVAAMDRAKSILAAGVGLTVVLAGLAILLAWWLAVIVLCGGAAIVAAFNQKLVAEARAMCSKECASADRAVGYVYWHGTHHGFEMLNQGFALAFMRGNARKLLNVDASTAQWLAQNGVQVAPPGQQAPRKYRT